MSAATLERVAAISGWQVRVFGNDGCPPADLEYQDDVTHGLIQIGTRFIRQRSINPQTSSAAGGHTGRRRMHIANGESPTTSQWQDASVSTVQKLAQPGTHVAILGAVPSWITTTHGAWPPILATHRRAAPSEQNAVSPLFDAERAAASATGRTVRRHRAVGMCREVRAVISGHGRLLRPASLHHGVRGLSFRCGGRRAKPAMT